ncbi:uncharacterized protein RCC_01152 [Ramularia collo-cygni]|uniref:Apple domain-containing protein n=1 Tax=Ramularia collo-cygni TaxID=112498 RepID=A0A2D3V1A9_9PEZI|nr:uncharacterized protein RCC_01152 [Ramularia collo-cygni]CZT15289.1 uncharacterized protein RCC_01152 [Ramularia collo-cygni]
MFTSKPLGVLYFMCLFLTPIQSQDNACSSRAPLPAGSGPIPTPDTPSAFYALSAIQDASNNAMTPANYTLAYSNLHASSSAEGYQGYSTLSSYNVTECARSCELNDRCVAFNIFFERSPSVVPGDETCTNPPSTTLIKCVLWSSEVSASNAVNAGQTRSQFEVVIAGSNGYNKRKPPPEPGYLEPVNLGKRAISAPTCNDGVRTGITQIFTSTTDPYNVTRAAQWCDTQYTRTRPCYFFNCYLATYASGPQTGRVFGQICDLYSTPWGKEYATKTQTRFDGPTLDVSHSFSYTSSDAPAACAAPPPA